MDMDIRPFDGSLRDARGILEIDRATFCDCPYSAERIVALLSDPGQHTLLAQEGVRILGYVSAFATHSIEAGRWEVDELAVHPSAQGSGIATALVARIMEQATGCAGLSEARALVAVDNLASQRVFVKNGFRRASSAHLLVYRVNGRVLRPLPSRMPPVRLARAMDRPAIARLLEADLDRVDCQLCSKDATYLVVIVAGGLGGCAELLHVRTLQYEGFWVEALVVSNETGVFGAGGTTADVTPVDAASALLHASIETAQRRDGIKEVGYLVDPRQTVPYEAALGEGMLKVDEYWSFVRDLQ
jgi:ribosomal protein S18 acetylase RimI-like enzyme